MSEVLITKGFAGRCTELLSSQRKQKPLSYAGVLFVGLIITLIVYFACRYIFGTLFLSKGLDGLISSISLLMILDLTLPLVVCSIGYAMYVWSARRTLASFGVNSLTYTHAKQVFYNNFFSPIGLQWLVSLIIMVGIDAILIGAVATYTGRSSSDAGYFHSGFSIVECILLLMICDANAKSAFRGFTTIFGIDRSKTDPISAWYQILNYLLKEDNGNSTVVFEDKSDVDYVEKAFSLKIGVPLRLTLMSFVWAGHVSAIVWAEKNGLKRTQTQEQEKFQDNLVPSAG